MSGPLALWRKRKVWIAFTIGMAAGSGIATFFTVSFGFIASTDWVDAIYAFLLGSGWTFVCVAVALLIVTKPDRKKDGP